MAVERGCKMEELEAAPRTLVEIEQDALEAPASQRGWRKPLGVAFLLVAAVATVGIGSTVRKPHATFESRRLAATDDGIRTPNGCPENMPTLYPNTHRCFQTGPIVDGGPGGDWGGAMCNIDPATDPVQHHRNDRKCVYYSDGPKTPNGCPANMPTLYPNTHRCFQSGPIVDGGPGGHWGGNMCNIDPATDPAPHHRNDKKCVYDPVIPASDGPKTPNGCPGNMPTRYPGTHRCFQSGPIVDGGPGGHWGGAMCNIDPATDPAQHHRNDRKCIYDSDIPINGDGPKTQNGCPMNMPTLYPGTHRCFQTGPIVDGGPGGHWGGNMCNIDPATDPAQHHRNDRKCIYGDGTKTKNGCTANMPTLYPGTHRCFQTGPIVDGGPGGHWGGSMCNIDPATDPAQHHRNDRKCDYTPRR